METNIPVVSDKCYVQICKELMVLKYYVVVTFSLLFQFMYGHLKSIKHITNHLYKYVKNIK